jgi:hypothetical protein
MTTRIWNKKETQAVLKELRTMYKVDKLPHGYSVKDDQGTEVLRAMIGNGSYLVRFSDGLFETN